MLVLTRSIAILGVHARLTRLEFDGTLLLFLATFGTAVVHTTTRLSNPTLRPRLFPPRATVVGVGD